MGVVMGPAVLIAATVPAVREAVENAEANPTFMVIFGLGMTVLLSVAAFEQGLKARRNRQALAAAARDPHRIQSVQKKEKEDGTTLLWLDMGDEEGWVRLEDEDAQHLLWLLTRAPLVFCPYCITPITEQTVDCPRCGQDTTRDAPHEMTLADYRAAGKRACPACAELMDRLAVRCPVCRTKV